MKSFLVACVVAIVIAVVCGALLDTIQKPADQAFSSTTGVRLGT
jgi:hypothetical protein